VADISSITYDMLKTAVEHIFNKLKEGKKLSTEDLFLLYLGTIADDLREIRTETAKLNARIDETNKRIDDLARSLSARIDETNKRIDAVQATLLEIQKLLIELVKSRQ